MAAKARLISHLQTEFLAPDAAMLRPGTAR